MYSEPCQRSKMEQFLKIVNPLMLGGNKKSHTYLNKPAAER